MAGRRGVVAAALAALTLAAATSGCGGDSQAAKQPDAEPLGEVVVGSIAQLAQCRDWSSGNREEKLATIDDIREQVNLQDSNVETPALSDKDAYRLLETTCADDFAQGLRLYKIYAKATGFAAFLE